MLTEEQKKQFTSLRVEIIDLDICASFFIRKANRFAHLWKATSRAFVLEELTALRYLENGIILHLTNLDDDNHNSSFSFRAAATEFNKSSKNPKTIKALHETLKSYRKEINELKVKYRNKRIAHSNSDEELGLDQFLNFEKMLLPIILEANRIADLLWGEKINAIFDLGSWEGKLDFKTNLSILKMDVNVIKGFTSNKLGE